MKGHEMVTRAAFIIANQGGGPMLTVLDGTPVDARRYPAFLRSDFGGAWSGDEIAVLENYERADILRSLGSANTDYSFVVFSGHGEHVDGEMRLWLNSDEYLSQHELATRSRRQLHIIDACRALGEEQLFEGRDKVATVGGLPNVAYRVSCRALYDKNIARAEEGLSTMYSCSLNQAAQETAANGGYFSYWLTRLARELAASNKSQTGQAKSVLHVPDAFARASNLVASRYPQQPVLENGRRMRSFPFAVA
jgi:hypothetical protein